MASSPTTTTFADIHPSIIQTHILPLLDGPSLSSVSATSSYLQALCTTDDDNLWSSICKSTWPSLTHPRVHAFISTFPAAHRSFFRDSFPALIADVNRRRSWSNLRPASVTPLSDLPYELISAVDIHYQNDVVYSRVKFTDAATDFLTSPLKVEFKRDPCSTRPESGISVPIGLKVDEISGADDATLSHLKESVTLNWILIDPARKRAGNISSIRPVTVKKYWMTNEIHLMYVTVLPGCDPKEMVLCRIKVTCAAGKGGEGLHVRQVTLEGEDLDCKVLNGKEFLVIAGRAISEENNVRRRKVVVGGEGERKYKEFKGMRKEKMEWVKMERQKKRDFVNKLNYCVFVVCFSLLFLQVCYHRFLK